MVLPYNLPTCLLVSPEPKIQEVVIGILSCSGITGVKTIEGEKVVDNLLKYTPDIVIIDLLPSNDYDPIDTLGTILHHRAESNLPIGVLGIAPNAEHENVQLATSAGIDLIMVDPIDEETLIEAMDQLFFS